MAEYDSADLLSKVRLITARNVLSSDASMSDASWYSFLSRGQVHWMNQIAIHCPGILGWLSATLTSSDSGATYTFPSSITPLTYELYTSATGRFLFPAWYPDSGGDYVPEGNKVRALRGGTMAAPFCRYIAAPTVIDGSTAPVLTPDRARMLIVYRAAILWAERGGTRDASYYQRLEDREWFGDPQRGDGGILLWLKDQNKWAGYAALPSGQNGSVSSLLVG